jgi:hypothetical protein
MIIMTFPRCVSDLVLLYRMSIKGFSKKVQSDQVEPLAAKKRCMQVT